MRPKFTVLGDEPMRVSLTLTPAPSAPKRDLRANAATLRLFANLAESWREAAQQSEPLQAPDKGIESPHASAN
jgi:hypothetical protein